MKSKNSLAALLFIASSAFCTVRNSQANIMHIESGVRSNGTKYVVLFFKNVTGDALPLGNGLTNEANQPYLMLADDNFGAGDVTNKQFMLSVALTAYSTGSSVDLNWDDISASNRIIAIRSK